MAEPKTMFSPQVIWDAAKLDDPTRTGPTGWKVQSRSDPTSWRYVHTDADADASSLSYANCSCPAGQKGARINQKIVPCGHVFRVLMLVASGKEVALPLDPAEEAVADHLDGWLADNVVEYRAEVEQENVVDFLPDDQLHALARMLVKAAREATKAAREAANAEHTS